MIWDVNSKGAGNHILSNQLEMLMEEAKSLELEIRESEVKLESPRRLASHGFRGNVAVGQGNVHASADSAYTRSPSGVSSRKKAS